MSIVTRFATSGIIQSIIDAFTNSSNTGDTETIDISAVPVVTGSSNGIMLATDKAKLDTIQDYAKPYTVADTVSSLGITSGGTATTLARGDHVHTMPSSDDVGAAPLIHTHTLDALGAAATIHTHDANVIGAAYIDHTHDPATIGAAPAIHTHTLDSLDAASAEHTHTLDFLGAAATVHTHTPDQAGAAPVIHTHTLDSLDAASAEHTHDANAIGAAYLIHTHDPMTIGAAYANHTHIPTDIGASPIGHTHTLDSLGAAAVNHTHDPAAIGAAYTVHTHALSDLGAAPVIHIHTPDQVGSAPLVHTHALSDLGAASTIHTHTLTALGAASNIHTHTLDSLGAAAVNHTHPVATYTVPGFIMPATTDFTVDGTGKLALSTNFKTPVTAYIGTVMSTSPKMVTATVVSDATGKWTLDVTGAGFLAIPTVSATAIAKSTAVADSVFAYITSKTKTVITGYVMTQNVVSVLGILSIKIATSVSVDVTVIGQ